MIVNTVDAAKNQKEGTATEDATDYSNIVAEVIVKTERDIFELIGMEYLNPREREYGK